MSAVAPAPRLHRRGGRPASYRASQHDFVDAKWPPSPHATTPGTVCPEVRLLCAVLSEAIQDALGRATIQGTEAGHDTVRARAQLQEAALDWMHALDPQPWGFSWVCEHLGLPPATVLASYPLFPRKRAGSRRS